MKRIILALAFPLVGCVAVQYEEVADFRLYEEDDPEGYALFTACVGDDGTFDGPITRGQAAALAEISKKIEAGERLSASDLADLPCEG